MRMHKETPRGAGGREGPLHHQGEAQGHLQTLLYGLVAFPWKKKRQYGVKVEREFILISENIQISKWLIRSALQLLTFDGTLLQIWLRFGQFELEIHEARK